MFADNDCISHRQLLRQMILALLGAWLLFLAGDASEQAENGLLGLFFGFVLLAVWSMLLLDSAKVYENLAAWVGKYGRAGIIAFYLSFLILTGSYLLERISGICSEYLVSGIRPEAVSLLLLVAAGVGVGNDIQRRARLAEIFYPIVMTGFVLLLLLAVFHMRPESFQETAGLSVEKIAGESLKTLGAGTILALLPFLLGQVDRENRISRPLLEGMGKLWFLLTAAAVILLGTFGIGGVRQMEVPVLQLMAGTRLPGEFLERFDIVWLALLLCSILFALGSILFYGSHLVHWKGTCGRLFRLALGTVVYAGSVTGAANGIAGWYPEVTRRFFLPAFLILTVLLWAVGKTGKKEKGNRDRGSDPLTASVNNKKQIRMRAAVLMGFLLLTLTGCGGVGPEERAYPLTVLIDRVPEGYQVIYDMADLSTMTGQDKQGDGGENGGDTGNSYTAAEFSQIWELYDACSQYELDTGHIKAVIFGETLLAEPEAVRAVMEWLEEDSNLGRNALVFRAQQPSAIMEQRGKLGDSIGVFLTGIYENREEKTRQPVTLDDVFYTWYNRGTIPEMPLVLPTDKGLECQETEAEVS